MNFVSKNLDVNEKGHLTIGGIDTVELKNKYGTPLYVIDENLVRENIRKYKTALEKYYDGNGMVLYASKAFSCKYILKVAMSEGAGLDVVSGGELYTALAADFPADKIYFHGNNKTADEITLAIKNNVGRIVVDNISELKKINEIAEKEGKCQDVMFRIKPGVDAHTHDFIRTGQIDSKFGFALSTGEAMEAVKETLKYENVKYVGVHCHIGSQIFELEPFCEAARIMMKFIKDISEVTGLTTKELNLGGGFGIKYIDSDDPVPYGSFIESVSKTVKECAKEYNLEIPEILMEPGRSLVGPAGITLYTVGAIKEIPDVRTYLSVDGGMGDNPRYILYGSKYSAVIANKADKPFDTTYTVAGKCCESGDLLMENAMLQKAQEGDTLAVLATGAYNYSMASNYNRIPRPPVVAVKDGEDKLIVKRETYDDLIKNDL